MADQQIQELPELVTSDDGTAFTLTVNNPVITQESKVYIEIVSGTWNFSNLGAAGNSSASYTTGEKVIQTVFGGKLNCKAANGSETFKISG